jgi:hypothetical protein
VNARGPHPLAQGHRTGSQASSLPVPLVRTWLLPFSWAILGNARREPWEIWHSWPRGICNLQILLTPQGFESLSLRHIIFRIFNRLDCTQHECIRLVCGALLSLGYAGTAQTAHAEMSPVRTRFSLQRRPGLNAARLLRLRQAEREDVPPEADTTDRQEAASKLLKIEADAVKRFLAERENSGRQRK